MRHKIAAIDNTVLRGQMMNVRIGNIPALQIRHVMHQRARDYHQVVLVRLRRRRTQIQMVWHMKIEQT